MRAYRSIVWLLCTRALYSLFWRSRTAAVPRPLSSPQKPFLAFSGSGLLLAYFHGIVTYIRDHFHVDNVQLSAISGGCSTMLALAMGIDLYQIMLLGLHLKKHYLRKGVYLNTFEDAVDDLCDKLSTIGVTDDHLTQLS